MAFRTTRKIRSHCVCKIAGGLLLFPLRTDDVAASTPQRVFQRSNELEYGIRRARFSRRLNGGACDAHIAQHRFALCLCAVRLVKGRRTLSVFQRIEGTTQCMPLTLFMEQIDDADMTKE